MAWDVEIGQPEGIFAAKVDLENCSSTRQKHYEAHDDGNTGCMMNREHEYDTPLSAISFSTCSACAESARAMIWKLLNMMGLADTK